MEQQLSQGNKNQRSGGAVLDTPVISFSQDFRLTQSQELMDTAKLAEMLTTFPNLSPFRTISQCDPQSSR